MKDPIYFYFILPIAVFIIQVLVVIAIIKVSYELYVVLTAKPPPQLHIETGLEARKAIAAQEVERAELTKRKLLAIAEFEELTNDEE